MTLIVQSYSDTLLRYVLSVTFCGAAILKVMDQKTLVKHRRGDKVRAYNCVYINTWRNCQTRVHKSLIGNNLPDTLSLFILWGNTTVHKQARRVKSPAERWTIAEIRRQFNSVLTFIFPAHRCPSNYKV